MTLLVLTHWQLSAGTLPEDLLDTPRESAFSLPGAAALDAFADLLCGHDAAQASPAEPAGEAAAAFSLPAPLPQGVSGQAALSREIDFGALDGDRAVLELDHVVGRGEVLLGGKVVASFDSADHASTCAAAGLTGAPCMLAVDLTDALRLGRKETLTLRFDETRPAGAYGPIALRTTAHAHLSRASILPDSARRTMTVRAQVTAAQPGDYILRVLPIAPGAPAEPQSVRELSLSLAAGETHCAQLALELPAGTFVPGQAYETAALKIQLFMKARRTGGSGPLCDETLLSCGFGARAPRAYLPLTSADCAGQPQALVSRLAALHICAVSLPVPAPESLYLAFDRAGISAHQFIPADNPLRELLLRHPCLTLSAAPLADAAPSPEGSAWQLCGSVAFPRAIDESLTPSELLEEAAGRALDAQDEGVQRVLVWLRAVSVRLRAEAARQGRCEGAFCAPGEDREGDIRAALETAFSPVHLSALPLCGAWWTGMRFSAVLEAFIPAGESHTAIAILEDENGSELARFTAVCARSGYAGVIEAVLPDHPCVLTLTTRLEKDGSIIEESVLPVYVGERGPLEAAFA